jgi:nucleoside-diphosphate-sugar epimerase
MHAIIGAGGAIGPELAKVLEAKNVPLRQVARSARKHSYGVSLEADIMDRAGAFKAVDGCEVAYLAVGLPYKLSVWETQWIPLINNLVNACSQTRTKLIFVDNIYMLSDDSIPHMTEQSPLRASSKKGKVRVDVDNILLDAMNEGRLQGIIARAADFYGMMPANKSLLLDLVIKKMVAGKSPQWFYTIDKKHSFTYTPDIARALFLLATDQEAVNQVWNLPTAPALTLREIIVM